MIDAVSQAGAASRVGVWPATCTPSFREPNWFVTARLAGYRPSLVASSKSRHRGGLSVERQDADKIVPGP